MVDNNPCDRPRPPQGLLGPEPWKSPKRVRKEYLFAGRQKPRKSAPWSLERVRKESKSPLFRLFSDSFETPGRTLSGLLGSCPGVLFPNSFRTLPGFRARRPGRPCVGRADRKTTRLRRPIEKMCVRRCQIREQKCVHYHRRKKIFWGTFLASKKNFRGWWWIQNPCESQENHIYHRNLSSVAPILFGKEKFCTGAGRCMLSSSLIKCHLSRCHLTIAFSAFRFRSKSVLLRQRRARSLTELRRADTQTPTR